VLQAVGVMSAPDHRRSADELMPVCRPGGTIALANRTPEGFIGALVRRFDRIGGDGPVAIPGECLEIVATRA
jgi:hypothetical protein